ncbi:MAG TPA: SIMPL domain-containing protein, partial [Clostridia bacterium]|nr:SIMPL domain-containing protein [Clostridia bacterium]
YGMPDYGNKGVYVVNNMIFVTLRDIDKVSAALDAAAAAGANNIYNLVFQSSQSTEAYHKALTRAVEDARAKAEVLARASGRQLGELVRIESGDYAGLPYGIQNRADFAVAEGGGATILSGDVSVTAYVTLSFALE